MAVTPEVLAENVVPVLDHGFVDTVGGFVLADGRRAKALTGVDDHSRFCVSAYLTLRETAQRVCDGLALAMVALAPMGCARTQKPAPETVQSLKERLDTWLDALRAQGQRAIGGRQPGGQVHVDRLEIPR